MSQAADDCLNRAQLTFATLRLLQFGSSRGSFFAGPLSHTRKSCLCQDAAWQPELNQPQNGKHSWNDPFEKLNFCAQASVLSLYKKPQLWTQRPTSCSRATGTNVCARMSNLTNFKPLTTQRNTKVVVLFWCESSTSILLVSSEVKNCQQVKIFHDTRDTVCGQHRLANRFFPKTKQMTNGTSELHEAPDVFALMQFMPNCTFVTACVLVFSKRHLNFSLKRASSSEKDTGFPSRLQGVCRAKKFSFILDPQPVIFVHVFPSHRTRLHPWTCALRMFHWRSLPKHDA